MIAIVVEVLGKKQKTRTFARVFVSFADADWCYFAMIIFLTSTTSAA